MSSDREQTTPPVDHVEDLLPSTLKKKKKKSGGRKKRRAITGFEEYYADPPTSPAEALRERQELYSSTVPFSRRIQTCIHRYRTSRILDNELAMFFSEYMFLGGIDVTGSQFGPSELEDGALIPDTPPLSNESTTEADDEAASSRYYDGNTRNWTVDFTSIVKGFLSVSILPLTALETEPTEKAIRLMENFLRYVLQHDVCLEYEQDIKSALAVCGHARFEWPRILRFQELLPGQFNLAAAKTFGVHQETDWSLRACKPSETLSPELIFYASLLAIGQTVPKDAAGKSMLRVTRQFTCSLELQCVESPSQDLSLFFRRLSLSSGAAAKRLNLQPLGRAVFRPTTIENGWVQQMPHEPLPEEDVVLYFEDPILEEMTTGMKVTARVCELSSGFRFVGTFETVQPSFYEFLPQHLMKRFAPPRVHDRPARSIHDKDVAEAGNDAGNDADAEE